MADPSAALFWGGIVLLICGILFWPQKGYYWNLRNVRKMTKRVFIEDALKHLYKCEYRRETPSVESLAGALGISGNQAADVLVGSEAAGLIQSEGGRLSLTADGRNYALHIIRAHRLWEHHLAEETGLSESDWHREADSREHDFSPEETEQLAAQMGNPVFDPHGDPIPTDSGDIAPTQGQSLTALPAGDSTQIVHIEDEPESVYAQLVAEGLYLGMHIQMIEVTPERLRFWADGDEHVLAPILASNISVRPYADVEDSDDLGDEYEALVSLRLGEQGKVIRISRGCRGLERRRLMDLGILPGTLIEVEMKSPMGDPTAYRIRGATIALRKEQANYIHITRQTEAA